MLHCVRTSENAVIGEVRFHRKEPEPTVSRWCQAQYKEPLPHEKPKLTSQEAPELPVDMRGITNTKVLSFFTYKRYLKRLTLRVGKRFYVLLTLEIVIISSLVLQTKIQGVIFTLNTIKIFM